MIPAWNVEVAVLDLSAKKNPTSTSSYVPLAVALDKSVAATEMERFVKRDLHAMIKPILATSRVVG